MVMARLLSKVDTDLRKLHEYSSRYLCIFDFYSEYIDGSHKIGNNSSEEVLSKAFKLFDYDKDGEITYKEFTWALHYLAATCYDRDANLNDDFTLNVKRK